MIAIMPTLHSVHIQPWMRATSEIAPGFLAPMAVDLGLTWSLLVTMGHPKHLPIRVLLCRTPKILMLWMMEVRLGLQDLRRQGWAI